MPGKEEMDPPEKKQWMTSWNENESYSQLNAKLIETKDSLPKAFNAYFCTH